MDYYIQGNEDKADQIKAAFKAKGCVMHTGIQCDQSDMIYFSLNGKVGGIKLRNLDLFKTHPDYKELELPIEPCFKVGDKIRSKSTQMTYTIIKIDVVNRRYELDYCSVMDFKEQDKFELAPKPHYDIKNFHAGMPVLVRDNVQSEWCYISFSHYAKNLIGGDFCAGGVRWNQCIPYECNEHLLGTTDPCDEQYINW